MKYYKPIEAELDRIGELGREAGKAYACMSFCLGVLANVIVGLILTTDLSREAEAVAWAIGAISAIAAGWFLNDGRNKRRREKTALERLKEAHDFSIVI